ncbi:alcohol dehydrogenase catalytic domain-containing protein [Arthrobacter bambusae]|uniref:alcohol dehydrogenase catalytic domain-containing protein n=1 Tax=Arthrobacter bambusae TaxID=1338426 RepID=UPI0027885F1F|nr:alcohol dehydrogenase catalytic domain-containing protein [Arthrobacter bambusae]MDQ0029925.1 alcohol dehydrogenase [Arthrobacter bambusae]MDQ0097557.1 alcohol dehydrogenase [Arthrobacter bambusae]
MTIEDTKSAARPATGTRTIRGAVLEALGAERPYSDTRPIHVQSLELEGPGKGEILVRIEAAGICHSDLSVVNGNRPRPVPMLIGHEAAGIVEELGEGVDDLAIGQRVVMTFLPRCGECAGCRSNGKTPCEKGTASNTEGTLLGGNRRLSRDGEPVHHHLGVSAFATHAVVSRRSVVPVGSDVPAHIAALLGCALLTGGGAILNVAKPAPSARVAIVGLGGVGMAALITAVGTGVEHVVGIDTLPAKLEAARNLGAVEAMTSTDALEGGKKFDAVIEAAGHPRALEAAVALTKPGGITVTVGLPAPGQSVAIDPLTLTAEARSIVGSYLGSAVPEHDIPIYEQLWRSGKLAVEGLVSDTIPLEEINRAMDTLDGGHALRQIITFS